MDHTDIREMKEKIRQGESLLKDLDLLRKHLEWRRDQAGRKLPVKIHIRPSHEIELKEEARVFYMEAIRVQIRLMEEEVKAL